MENQTYSNLNCACGNGCCCTPQKKTNPWKKWIFIGIVLAAGAIVTVKLLGNHNAPAKCCEKPEHSTCKHKPEK